MRRKRARPFWALLRADFRMLRRHGVGTVYLLLGVGYALGLRYLAPEDSRGMWTALLLFSDPGTLALFFMGAIVLYEKNQRVYGALYAAGVTPGRYLAAKCLSAALLGTAVGCFVSWFSNPAVTAFAPGAELSSAGLEGLAGRLNLSGLLQGDLDGLWATGICMGLGGVFFTCVSLIPAGVCASLNGFVLLSALAEALLVAPAMADCFLPLPEAAGFHPGVFLLRLLTRPEGVLAWRQNPMLWEQGAAFLGWMILAFWAARGMCRRLLCGKGGL